MSYFGDSKLTDATSNEYSSNELPWYAIRVRSNYEHIVATALKGKGHTVYLPLYRKRVRTSAKYISLPLMPGYVLSRIDLSRRLPILTTPGVVGIISFGNTFVPVAEREIEAVQRVERSGIASIPWPYLREGDRVRVTEGALEGVEGVLVRSKTECRVVVSIELLQRSAAVEIDRRSVEPAQLPPPSATVLRSCAEIGR
jgi:transcription antitermination factor NusG